MFLPRALGSLARAVPARCEVCRAWPARPVCAACDLRFAAPRPRCPTCAAALPPGASGPCGACLRSPPPLEACHAAVSWGYPWSSLVARYKFAGEVGWAGIFADLLLRDPAVRAEVARARWLLPMPLSDARLAARGFNQAHELARRLDARKAAPHLVLRLRDTPAQAGLDRAQRLRNLRGAFAAEPLHASRLRGTEVLLVDDVMTTGASLAALATVVRAAGAVRVAAVALCRTEDPASPAG